MTREPTPWERLDGVKHSLKFISVALDSIIEGAVEWEKSRIIKLLEESMAICAKNQHEDGCDACYGQRDAIALIKGENK